MDVRENYVMQKESRKEKSICPNCIHHNLCIAENNQPCFECNRFIDANGVTVQEWIPVTERLPSIDETILVYDGDVDTGIFYKGAFQTFDENGYPFEISGVTHWMPLPQPPKGE